MFSISPKEGRTTCAHPLHPSNLKVNGSRVPAALATHSFVLSAARRLSRNAAADASSIAAIGAATKPAGRAILRFQLLPGGVARQSHDPLKIRALDQRPTKAIFTVEHPALSARTP